MKKIREDYYNFYLKLDNNNINKLEENGKIYTHGIGANGIGGEYIRLDHMITSIEEVAKTYQKNNCIIDELFKDYDKNKEEIERLESYNDNSYDSYYNIVHSILTNEEIEQIQKEIEYNFMSLSFTSRLEDLLKYEKLRKVA